MSKREKRLKKIRQNPNNVSLKELQQVLEDYGFAVDRITGSHYIFLSIDTSITLTIPFARPVRKIYVDKTIEAIDTIILQTQNTEDDDVSDD